MPARDAYHAAVRKALEKEQWDITADPLHLEFLDADLWVDLGAEKLLAAERSGRKIAVEIKSFLRASALSEFHDALGQYMNYQEALDHLEPDRTLYLAVPLDTYESFFLTKFGQHAIRRFQLKLLVYIVESEEIAQWIP
ncbi:MAG: XisH family protein [Caldilineaceae bacterium]